MTSPDGTEFADLTVDSMQGSWDYGRLPKNISLGERVLIQSPRLLAMFRSRREPGLVLGDDVRLYLGGWGGSLSIDVDGVVEIGPRSVLAGVQLMCMERITIGADVSLSYNVVLADSDYHPRDPLLRRSDAISAAPFGQSFGFSKPPSAPVVIEDGVTIGINALILKGVRIGFGARILPGSVVTRDVPAGGVVGGNPARPVDAP